MFFLPGIFKAPAKGLYHFSIYHFYPRGTVCHAFFYKNTQILATVRGDNPNGWDHSANGVTVQLEEGDEVYVKLGAGARLYDDSWNYSFFNGVLLFTL